MTLGWTAVGIALVVAAALLLRRPAPLLPSGVGGFLLGYGPILLFFALVFALTGRTFFSGGASLVAAGGVSFADWLKRRELREPLVFADAGELRELVLHPRFYLPFVPLIHLLLIVAGVALVAALVLWLEPPVPVWPLPSLASAALLAIALAVLMQVDRLPLWLRAQGIAGQPGTDIARHGLAAILLAYAVLARFERSSRLHAVRRHSPALLLPGIDAVVVVQNESFFDLRRLGPGLLPQGLPAFDRRRAEAMHHGRLAVPAWGANTVRSEFAVLTGIGEAELGLDRFNPYFRFARSALPSLAWQFRAAGFRTVCLHPFDRGFYGRHAVMPCLGFETFLGQETLCAGGPMDDPALADRILAMLAEDDRPLFVFAITMGNHGPWQGGAGEGPSSAFDSYREGLYQADAMIARLCDGLEAQQERQSLLAFYGDHQPNIPALYHRPGFADGQTDYFIWSPARRTGARRDIAAEGLAQLIVTSATAILATVGLRSHVG